MATLAERAGADREMIVASLYHHQDFQGRHYYAHFARPTDLREQFRDEPWFALCEQFTDDWDQVAVRPGRPGRTAGARRAARA